MTEGCDPPGACDSHGRCWAHSTEDKCDCGSNDFAVSATLIKCKACGRTWGRVNGTWVLDPDTVPKQAVYDPHRAAAEDLFSKYDVVWGPEAGKRPCGLTFDQLTAACRNIGFDLTCAVCAANFFTGTGATSHDEGCATAKPDAWTDDDVDDEWTASIRAAFPTRSGRHDTYEKAMVMVGHRRSKGALVALVNWLLTLAGEKP